MSKITTEQLQMAVMSAYAEVGGITSDLITGLLCELRTRMSHEAFCSFCNEVQGV